MISLLLRLPSIFATLARAFRDISYGCLAWYVTLTSDAEAPTVQEIPLQPPQLSREQQAVLSEAHQLMANDL